MDTCDVVLCCRLSCGSFRAMFNYKVSLLLQAFTLFNYSSRRCYYGMPPLFPLHAFIWVQCRYVRHEHNGVQAWKPEHKKESLEVVALGSSSYSNFMPRGRSRVKALQEEEPCLNHVEGKHNTCILLFLLMFTALQFAQQYKTVCESKESNGPPLLFKSNHCHFKLSHILCWSLFVEFTWENFYINF